MSASHFPVLRATAMQAATALASYERHVRKLAAIGLDIDLYSTVSREIDDIKLLCAALPGVALPWAALLVSHADLIHALWRKAQPVHTLRPLELTYRLEEHLGCIDVLARRCLRISDRYPSMRDAAA